MTQIKITQITERINVRSIKPKGVERLRTKIDQVGYLPEKPVIVAPNGDGETYILIDGNHRIAALEELGRDSVEALIDETLVTEAMQLRRARLANEVSETVIPTTFVDDAELVWSLADKGMTQTDIGGVLGWGRGKVSQYAMLQSIDEQAWGIIATTSNALVADDENGTGSIFATTGSIFSERLLRQILSLASEQQFNLVSDLAAKKIDKRQFGKLGQVYKTRNQIKAYITNHCPGIPEDFLTIRLTDVDKGGYDSDWQTEDKSKIQQLIKAISDEWQQKSATKLILGDFESEVLNIDDGIIDLILTDPPYGISEYKGVTKQGNQLVTADFDGDEDWDTVAPQKFQNQLSSWVDQWARILRPGGAIVTFCDKVLISDLWRLFKEKGLIPKNIIIWAKDNPSPAGLARNNLISSVEFMIWGVKPGDVYVFNKSENWDRENIINAPLCAGDERIKNDKGKTLHPTQKPLKILLPLTEVFSNRGGLVFDGFMGVGSTGDAAKQLGRKFIGVERQEDFYIAAQKRLA